MTESPGWRMLPRCVRVKYVMSLTPRSDARATVASARRKRPFWERVGSMSMMTNSTSSCTSAREVKGERQ